MPAENNLMQLTDTEGYNREPSWSPDGSPIAFWSDRSGDHEIFLMNADGSSQLNLTNSPGRDENPTWLPEID
jgi:Tol biopolymer transport system component